MVGLEGAVFRRTWIITPRVMWFAEVFSQNGCASTCAEILTHVRAHAAGEEFARRRLTMWTMVKCAAIEDASERSVHAG